MVEYWYCKKMLQFNGIYCVIFDDSDMFWCIGFFYFLYFLQVDIKFSFFIFCVLLIQVYILVLLCSDNCCIVLFFCVLIVLLFFLSKVVIWLIFQFLFSRCNIFCLEWVSVINGLFLVFVLVGLGDNNVWFICFVCLLFV